MVSIIEIDVWKIMPICLGKGEIVYFSVFMFIFIFPLKKRQCIFRVQL